MKLETRVTIHAGVNFIVAPAPSLDPHSFTRFQCALLDAGVTFTRAEYGERRFSIIREKIPLEITVAVVGPQIGQLLIVSPQPNLVVDSFGAEADDVVRAFDETWPFERRQVVTSDATLRDLYDTTSEHAFVELWVQRLHQAGEALIGAFGRPVLGGGLRFVMPPLDQPDEPLIEVKIESYLKDTTKLFLETQFAWQQPAPPGLPLNPVERLEQLDRYVRTEVVRFMMEGQ